MTLLVSAPLGTAYGSDVFWNPNEEVETDITDKEFALNIKEDPAKTFGDLEIYDTRRSVGADSSDQSDEMKMPLMSNETPPREELPFIASTRPSVRSGSSAPPRRSPQVRRAPDPVRHGGPQQGPVAEVAKPEPRKPFQFGKVEVKPVEPKQKKFDWGTKK